MANSGKIVTGSNPALLQGDKKKPKKEQKSPYNAFMQQIVDAANKLSTKKPVEQKPSSGNPLNKKPK